MERDEVMPDMEKEVQEQKQEENAADVEETAEKEMDMEAASSEEPSESKEEAESQEARAEESEEPQAVPEDEKAEGKKLFGKKDKKKDKAQEKIEELEDKVKRQLAEFENFRNRSEKEKTAMFETGAKSVIEKILPVIDNFERGLMAVPEDEKDSPFVEGMNKIYKQMVTELESIGVKPIEAVGLEFDPNLHNAVMQVESEEFESGVVAQELQKGYTYHDLVVRHSMVAVVQ